jgi:hypothetical protein
MTKLDTEGAIFLFRHSIERNQHVAWTAFHTAAIDHQASTIGEIAFVFYIDAKRTDTAVDIEFSQPIRLNVFIDNYKTVTDSMDRSDYQTLLAAGSSQTFNVAFVLYVPTGTRKQPIVFVEFRTV